MRLNLALSGFEQKSNSIVLSGLVSTFRLFTANDIIVIIWQKILDYWSNFDPACDNATSISYSGWEYFWMDFDFLLPESSHDDFPD